MTRIETDYLVVEGRALLTAIVSGCSACLVAH
jgi:AhpD family alkylhydroperoxidase